MILVSALVGGCVEKGCIDPEAINYNPEAQRDDESCYYGDKNKDLKKDVLRNHANLAFALYSDAYAESVNLSTTVSSFIDKPTDDAFSECRLAWKLAYNKYLKCDALRFSDGPIDDTRNLDRLIGAWPINEALIDYVGNSNAGIVNDPTLVSEISSSSLEAKNETLGSGQVTTGFHVIEFLLWGTDTSDLSVLATGGRSFNDYNTEDSTVLNADRRQAYLIASAELLTSNLAMLLNEWDSLGVDNYRASFLSLEPNDGLKLIMTGLGTLTRGELAERSLKTPVEKQDQGLEISNFSDNTSADIISMKRSIEIVYSGAYTSESGLKVKGASLSELTNLLNPELGKEVDETLDLLNETILNIPAPFDRQMAFEGENGPGPIDETVEVLFQLEDHWFKAAREMGFGLTTDLPD